MTIGYQAQSFETEISDNSLDKKRERHKELSITVRRTMYLLLAYSASCGVIIAQPDVPFVLTSSGVTIPVINATVNLKAFLVVGPLGLIAITTYLHLFLAKLNRITGLDEYDKQPFLFNFQDRFSRLLGFFILYVTPIFLMLGFSWKSAVTDWRILMHFATMVVTVGMLSLYLKVRLKLRFGSRWFNTVIFIIVGIVLLAGLAFLSLKIGFNLRRNLNLERAELMKAKLMRVNLVRANLRFADLSGANLSEASLRGADLRYAILSGADLTGANLWFAYLHGAVIDDNTRLPKKWQLVWALVNKHGEYSNLPNTDLSRANLYQADLELANLRRANLSEANLSYAKLSVADLREADLHEADLHEAELSNANLFNANLRYAKLNKVNLSGAKLFKANLSVADLSNANLRETDLGEADLRATRNLKASQLCEAKTLFGAKFDSELEKQVKQQCPDLLKQ